MKNSSGRRLVILAASFRRLSEPKEAIPAIKRFDGVYFRQLRKYLREGRLKNTDVVIVSPEYGLLTSEDKVPPNTARIGGSWHDDLNLDNSAVSDLREKVLSRLTEVLRSRRYREVYVNVGASFLPLIRGFERLTRVPITWAQGKGLGPKAKHMKEWILAIDS